MQIITAVVIRVDYAAVLVGNDRSRESPRRRMPPQLRSKCRGSVRSRGTRSDVPIQPAVLALRTCQDLRYSTCLPSPGEG